MTKFVSKKVAEVPKKFKKVVKKVAEPKPEVKKPEVKKRRFMKTG